LFETKPAAVVLVVGPTNPAMTERANGLMSLAGMIPSA
jgi:hypothetical protein